MKNIKKISIFTVSFILLFSFTSLVFAHEGVEHGSEEEAKNHYYTGFLAVMPFVYFAQGEYLTGILVCLLWFGVIYGFYTFSLLLLGRVMHKDKKK